MSDETLFYVIGGILAVSAVVFTFAGLKLKNFPGRALPIVIVWFAILACGAATTSVLQAKEHEAHESEAHHSAEGAKSGPYENEGGALGGEREELEEQAEKEGEGATEEEEPVGETEGGQSDASEGKEGAGGATGANSGAGATASTLKLAADETELAFDPTELSAKAGKVTIDFDNPSAIEHNVVIEQDEKEVAGIEPITESKKSFSADLEAGTYDYVCTVPGHEEAGMVGTLTVE